MTYCCVLLFLSQIRGHEMSIYRLLCIRVYECIIWKIHSGKWLCLGISKEWHVNSQHIHLAFNYHVPFV